MQRTFEIDQLYASTWEVLLQKGWTDNIYDATPLTYWLLGNDRKRPQAGGKFIVERLLYGKNNTVTFIKRGGLVDLTPTDPVTSAIFWWKYAVGTIIRYGIDEQQNAGSAEIANMVQENLEVLKMSVEDVLERVFILGDGVKDEEPVGIRTLISTEPEKTNIGDIDPVENTWWRNRVIKASGAASSTLLNDINHLYNLCRGGKDDRSAPDLVLTSLAVYEVLQNELRAKYEFLPTDENIPFPNIKLNKMAVMHSASCDEMETELRIINSSFIKLVVDPRWEFSMTDWKSIPNQVEDRVAQIKLACNLTISNRKKQGVLYDIQLH